LFATFLTVNAVPFQPNKRAITFRPCPNNFPIDPLIVEMVPETLSGNELVKFNVSGIITLYDITKNKTFLDISFSDVENYREPTFFVYNKPFDQSYAAKSQFSIHVSDVNIPALPKNYFISVTVEEPEPDPLTIGCASASVSH
ncbi:143_t:CDS:1, partial [Dentiscutata heterogama]